MTFHTPPNGVSQIDIPLVHKICCFYKEVYLFSQKIPKKDRFGIYLKIENTCLEIIELSIQASLLPKNRKIEILNSARIKIESLKRLIRIFHELKIIPKKKYFEFQTDLQEISKMTNGWIKYLSS